jgi:hypothetical protein
MLRISSTSALLATVVVCAMAIATFGITTKFSFLAWASAFAGFAHGGGQLILPLWISVLFFLNSIDGFIDL